MMKDLREAVEGSTDRNRLEKADAGRRAARYFTAAGLGAFAFGNQAEAAITVVDPVDFGVQGASSGWLSETYAGAPGMSFGVDILQNGGALDVGFFQGAGYGGYLIARTDQVGFHSLYPYYYGNISGSGQLRLLNNPANPDGDGPATSLDGFNAGEVIGDDETIAAANSTMRNGYSPYDWQGVPTGSPSYVGFEIDIDNNGSFDGFGWIEVIVNDSAVSLPTLTVTRWAYTDDGSTIQAGQVPEPTTLALLAAGAGALAFRRREAA